MLYKMYLFIELMHIYAPKGGQGGGGGGYGFLFRSQSFFRTTQELEYLFFLSRKAQNFFQEVNIRLYDKNSESDYFFLQHVDSTTIHQITVTKCK
jgi:hypothetical protein